MYSNSTKALKHFVVGIVSQLATLLLLVSLITPTATGQTQAFNYQGKLTHGRDSSQRQLRYSHSTV